MFVSSRDIWGLLLGGIPIRSLHLCRSCESVAGMVAILFSFEPQDGREGRMEGEEGVQPCLGVSGQHSALLTTSRLTDSFITLE